MRSYTSPSQFVTGWAEKGISPDLGANRWVMVGGNNIRNRFLSGVSKYPSNNYAQGIISSENLAAPSGWEGGKAVLGQRIIK